MRHRAWQLAMSCVHLLYLIYVLLTTLDVKNSTAPEKTLKKHVFLGLKKNTKKHFSHLGSQSIGRGRISREGALDHRESRERRDKIFAAKTVKRQNFQKTIWIPRWEKCFLVFFLEHPNVKVHS